MFYYYSICYIITAYVILLCYIVIVYHDTDIILYYGRFPKFHRVFLGRDPGTLKSDIASKKYPQ